MSAEVEDMPNGTKFFMNGNGSTIFWKRECGLAESMFPADEKYGLSALTIVQKVGDGIAVVGSDKGAFLIDVDTVESPDPFNPLKVEAKDVSGNHVKLTSASRGKYAS